jgi:hypothetical protein
LSQSSMNLTLITVNVGATSASPGPGGYAPGPQNDTQGGPGARVNEGGAGRVGVDSRGTCGGGGD